MTSIIPTGLAARPTVGAAVAGVAVKGGIDILRDAYADARNGKET